MNDETATYPPLNVLKGVTDDLWIVDGPLIRFGPPLLRMPFPTRMTVIRLAGGNLFVHSPTPLMPELRGQIDPIGTVRWIVGPNRIHYWWIPDWKSAFPQAEVYLAPRIKERAGARINFEVRPLETEHGYPWDGEIATLPIRGRYMTEVEFFHWASRTLVITDLIENFERRKLSSRLMRWLTRIDGIQDPDGQTPRDMRLTFRGYEAEVRAAVEQMIAWNPERIILAHGRWYESGASDELRRAFRWVL